MITGLYFGSFNPMHIGHLQICRYLLRETCVERVILVVTPQNPLKDSAISMSAQRRLEDVRRVAKSSGLRIDVSDIEFYLPTPIYTINTLREFQKKSPDERFILVMGADNIAILKKWYKYKEILSEFEVWVYPRHGFDGKKLAAQYGVKYLDAPLIEISSTQIRDGEKAGVDMSEFRV